jgi:hypothetical protein
MPSGRGYPNPPRLKEICFRHNEVLVVCDGGMSIFRRRMRFHRFEIPHFLVARDVSKALLPLLSAYWLFLSGPRS